MFYTNAFQESEKMEETPGILGLIYYDLGKTYYLQKDFHNAFIHLEEALSYFEKENLLNSLVDIKKKDYYQEAIRLWETLKNK